MHLRCLHLVGCEFCASIVELFRCPPTTKLKQATTAAAALSTTPSSTMASHQLPEHFAQADSLLTGIIDNYRNSADASEMAEVVSMLEHAVNVARDREFRVQDSIKGRGAESCVREVHRGFGWVLNTS